MSLRPLHELRIAILATLSRSRVLLPLFRLRIALDSRRAARLRNGKPLADDGLPLPPPRLMILVAGTADVDWFLDGGAEAAEDIRQIVQRSGAELEHAGALLDFGCGCGRVLRQWNGLSNHVAMYGSDCNDAHVSWCEAHLPFARVVGHGLRPPAPFADASFGFVYGLSVFTHLPEEVQLAWMTELRRVLRPGGLLLMSFHGEGFAERMTHRERRRFESGHVVVRRPELAPTNLCMTFHPRDYVTDVLADGLDVVAFEPNGLAGMRQDVVLLRKPSEPAAT